MATIERDNRILLEKMSYIMRTKGRVDNRNPVEFKRYDTHVKLQSRTPVKSCPCRTQILWDMMNVMGKLEFPCTVRFLKLILRLTDASIAINIGIGYDAAVQKAYRGTQLGHLSRRWALHLIIAREANTFRGKDSVRDTLLLHETFLLIINTPFSSLNREKRTRELLRVAKENQEILHRIMKCSAELDNR